MSGLVQPLAVAGGAAAGALLRWGAGLWLSSPTQAFPLGTLAVNCVGGFLIGIAMVGFTQWPDELLKLLLVTGFLGGFTTFSAFSAESLALLQRGHFVMAAAHALAHVLGALACTALGAWMASQSWRA